MMNVRRAGPRVSKTLQTIETQAVHPHQALCIFYSALVSPAPQKVSLSVHKTPHLKSREVTYQCGEEHHFGYKDNINLSNIY